MNRYSKISHNRSRSTALPDLTPFPQTPRKSISSNTKPIDQIAEVNGGEEVNGERFGEVLSRARSVSSSSTATATTTTTPRAIQCAVKRAFSMRRCSSVTEGYSRIHDRPVTLSSPVEDHGEEGVRSGKVRRRGKILKVCKLIFGL